MAIKIEQSEKTKIIYKYKIPRSDCTLELPLGAQFVDALYQGDELVMWFLIDVNLLERTQRRRFLVLPTGIAFECFDGWYLKTALRADGFVAHLFEGLV